MGADAVIHYATYYPGAPKPLASEFATKALRRIFLARSKRALVAGTEMPASSAISFIDLSFD
jgi:hypothetical protein